MCAEAPANPYIVTVSSTVGQQCVPDNPYVIVSAPWFRASTKAVWAGFVKNKEVFGFRVVREMPQFAGHGNTGGYWYDKDTDKIYLFRVIQVSHGVPDNKITNLNIAVLGESDGHSKIVESSRDQVNLSLPDLYFILWREDAVQQGVDLAKHTRQVNEAIKRHKGMEKTPMHRVGLEISHTRHTYNTAVFSSGVPSFLKKRVAGIQAKIRALESVEY